MNRKGHPTSACQRRFRSGWVSGLYDRLERTREGARLLQVEAGDCGCAARGYLAGLLNIQVKPASTHDEARLAA